MPGLDGMQRVNRHPYLLLVMGAAAGLLVIMLDLLVDYFFIYENKAFIQVVMINLRTAAIWTDCLIVSSYIGFSYLLMRIQRSAVQEQRVIDDFLFKLLDSFKSLRYNLYSMKMAVHVARYNMEPPPEMLHLVEQGIEKSVALINNYLAASTSQRNEDED